MTINTTLAGLSQTVSSNGPDGAVDAPSTLDDALRYHGAFIAKLRDDAIALGLTTAGGTSTATTAEKNTAADTLGAFRRGTLLGTCSQTSGVPTGAVIETGTNASGTYTRFADGTQICYGSFTATSYAVTSASGYQFIYLAGVSILWATAFIAAPVGNLIALSSGTGLITMSNANAFSTTSGSGYLISPISVTTSVVVGYFVVGRWF